MKRKFVSERGLKASPQDRQISDVLYSLDEAIEIFIRAKKAQGLRTGTINGYHDIFRYFKQWLNEEVMDVNDITPKTIRDYINYLRTERTPYAEDPQRRRSGKELSVYTINIRIRGLSTFSAFCLTMV